MKSAIIQKIDNCPFCWEKEKFAVDANYQSNGHAFAVNNVTPLTENHFLAITLQHGIGYADLQPEQVVSLYELTCNRMDELEKNSDRKILGYSIGINDGETAGQTVLGHLHMHVLPRYEDDIKFGSLDNILIKWLEEKQWNPRPLNRTETPYRELGVKQILADYNSFKTQIAVLKTIDPTITGFNIVTNVGKGAGSFFDQGVDNCLIPRREKDMLSIYEADRPGGLMRAFKRKMGL